MTAPPTVLIAGPTASGKSALALAVATRLRRAVIVNADSMQVYRDLRILTARPTVKEESQVPHRLFGTVDGADAYSVARYVSDAAEVLAAARTADATPIFVGGTGLYFKALLEGLSPVPPIDPAVRERLRAEAAEYGAAEMHRRLELSDPEMADRLVPTDTQRITRALEVIEATGRSLAAWQREPGVPVIAPESALRFVLGPDRDVLFQRCDSRVDAMVAAGALAEVERLGARHLSPELPVMRALGVAPLLAVLTGRLPLDQGIASTKVETRQFAKRQYTWLRRHMSTWNVVQTQETQRSAAEIISFIE